MAIELISKPEYRLTSLKGFENVVFLERGTAYVPWPQAITDTKAQGGVLQSAREGIAWRIEAFNTPHQSEADKYQATRTTIANVLIDGKFYAAVDDSASTRTNIILARAQEGYDSHVKSNTWLVPTNDPYVKGILNRAEKADRIVELTDENPLERPLQQENGASPYTNEPLTKAILLDLAEPNAQYLASRGFKNGRTYHLTPTDLQKKGVDKKHAEIRVAGLGDDDFYDVIYYLNASNRLYYYGRAAGVRFVGARKVA